MQLSERSEFCIFNNISNDPQGKNQTLLDETLMYIYFEIGIISYLLRGFGPKPGRVSNYTNSMKAMSAASPRLVLVLMILV